MGEANTAANALIASVIGEEPRFTMNEDWTMSLHLGEVVMTAQAALLGDPSTFQHADGSIEVYWGGQSVTLRSPANPER